MSGQASVLFNKIAQQEISCFKEPARIEALEQYDILDTSPEPAFDNLAYLASSICRTPVGLVAFADQDRVWFKSRVGFAPRQLPMHVGFCALAMVRKGAVVIRDTLQDKRLLENPLVKSRQGIRFYAGVPLVTPKNFAIGAIAVMDRVPRRLNNRQIEALHSLRDHAVALLELRRQVRAEQRELQEMAKKQEQTLALSKTALREFTSAISHDLKDPLYTAAHRLHLLAKHYTEQLDSEAKELISNVLGGLERMDELIRDLLTFVRTDKRDIPFLPVDCAVVLEWVCANLQVQIQESGGAITSDRLPVVKGHKTQLVELFQNIISNAIKYRSPDRPLKIHVGCNAVNEDWLFTISDNGRGVDIGSGKQTLHCTSACSKFPFCSSVGMKICEKIVLDRGGKIWVESEPGKGTAVSFTIPVKATQ